MTVSLSPATPATGSQATLTIRGTADETAVPAVIGTAAPSCPARLPTGPHTIAYWSEDASVALGPFTRKVIVFMEKGTQRFCAYLQPAVEVDGDLQVSSSKPPLARAEAALPKSPVRPLRGEPNGGVSGATRDGHGATLRYDRSSRRIVIVRTMCGGSALHPGSLGKEFIGKRFSTRVSLPLTRTIRWSGRITPANSQNYDAPVPAAWTRPIRLSLDVRVVVRDGLPRALVGTGVLSSPGPPCATVRRYVFP